MTKKPPPPPAQPATERVRYEVYGMPIETIIASANAASDAAAAAAKQRAAPEPEPAWPSLEELAGGAKPQATRRGRVKQSSGPEPGSHLPPDTVIGRRSRGNPGVSGSELSGLPRRPRQIAMTMAGGAHVFVCTGHSVAVE